MELNDPLQKAVKYDRLKFPREIIADSRFYSRYSYFNAHLNLNFYAEKTFKIIGSQLLSSDKILFEDGNS